MVNRTNHREGRGDLVRKICMAVMVLMPLANNGAKAQSNVVVLASDGAWTWYNDPRAVMNNGVLYFGYVRHGDGRTVLNAFDARSGKNTELWTSQLAEKDDHNVPGLLVRQDGRMLAIWSRHNTDKFFSYRLSKNPRPVSPADWGEEQRSPDTGAGMTYANPIELSAEDGRVYDFARNLNFNPTVFISTKGGSDWWAPKALIQTGNGSIRPYVKYASDGRSRIDFLYTDGHPRDVTNSLYHLYYEGGGLRRTDGSLVKRFAEIPLRHDAGERGSVIYEYHATPQTDPNQWIPTGRAWCWEIVPATNGRPICVFTVQRDYVTGTNWTDDRIYYYYGRWTGTNWQKRMIANAGRPLYRAEDDYAGGICMDPENPDVLYLSSNAAEPFKLNDPEHVSLSANARYELWRGETRDGGLTFVWTAVTANSAKDNLRPYIPRGQKSAPIVMWFRGTYRAYTDYDCEVVGLFQPPK